MATIVEASLGVEGEDTEEAAAAAAVGLVAGVATTPHRPIHVILHLRDRRLIYQEEPQTLQAGGQASGPELRLGQPEPIWLVTADKRKRRQGPEDGMGAVPIMVKAAQGDGQDRQPHRVLLFHRRGIQALALEARPGDDGLRPQYVCSGAISALFGLIVYTPSDFHHS